MDYIGIIVVNEEAILLNETFFLVEKNKEKLIDLLKKVTIKGISSNSMAAFKAAF